jgi:hypothetical protein
MIPTIRIENATGCATSAKAAATIRHDRRIHHHADGACPNAQPGRMRFTLRILATRNLLSDASAALSHSLQFQETLKAARCPVLCLLGDATWCMADPCRTTFYREESYRLDAVRHRASLRLADLERWSDNNASEMMSA